MQASLFGLGQRSRSPAVTAKQLTNLYCEQRPQGEDATIVAYGTPGLNLFTSFGDTPVRGGIEFEKNSVIYVVHRGILWEVNNAGVQTNRGVLATTSGRVSMAHNGTQIMLVDGTSGYIYNTSTLAFVTITDVDFPANPTTCCFLTGRFLASFEGSSRFYWSALYDGTSWDALDFANAESNSDPIVSVYASNGQAILMGTDTTEFWGNSGVADTAFTLLQGTATEWGLAARWSIDKFDNTFACLMKNRMGQVMVAQMNGYLPKKISSVDMDFIINSYAATSDASAYSYMLGGHPMYVISFPTALATWLYDGSTGIWTALKSYGITRHLSEFSFNLVGRTLVTDYAAGNIYVLTDTALTDNGQPIEAEIVGETVMAPDMQFFSVDSLRVDMEVGVGLTVGQGSNPQISLSVSRDNGQTWGAEMWKTMGAIGEYGARVEWRRLGTTRVFTPKIRITDPVKRVFVGAYLNAVN
jgi:hypothetical protein